MVEGWAESDAPLELITNETSPEVALSALWSSSDGTTLYLWGGSSSDSPDKDPPDPAIWSFDIENEQWNQMDASGDSVIGLAEGAVGTVSLTRSRARLLHLTAGLSDTSVRNGSRAIGRHSWWPRGSIHSAGLVNRY